MNALRPSVAAALMLAVSLTGPARADAPTGHYVIVSGTGNGSIILDTKSKLTWMRATRLGTWTDARTTCAGLTTDGGGWRLPTYKELLTLLDLSVTNIVEGTRDRMDPVFGAIGLTGHWSATPDATNPEKAWMVNFFYGDTYSSGIVNMNAYKCVR